VVLPIPQFNTIGKKPSNSLGSARWTQCSDYERVDAALSTTIYVKMLDEGTDVWRPVVADKVSEDVFRLVGTHDDSEEWEFPTGSLVRVENRKMSSGMSIVAVALAE